MQEIRFQIKKSKDISASFPKIYIFMNVVNPHQFLDPSPWGVVENFPINGIIEIFMNVFHLDLTIQPNRISNNDK